MEKFCLKWNDFQHNIVTSFNELRVNNEFSDVTLVCEENQQIEAHKIILTACSPFFSSVLRKNQHSHPMIYMRGLNARYLISILDFIYNGEANLFQEDLDGFLALAEELELKGLTKYPQEAHNNKKEHISKSPPNIQEKSCIQQEKVPIKKTETKQEHLDYHENRSVVSVDKEKYDLSLNTLKENMEEKINSMMEPDREGKTKWKCTVCGKGARDRTDMGRHIETHIEGVSYPCDQCGKTSRSSMGLVNHISKYHRK